MKGKFIRIAASLVALMLVITLVPLASSEPARAVNDSGIWDVIPGPGPAQIVLCECNIIDMAVGSDGNTLYVIRGGVNIDTTTAPWALYKSLDGGETWKGINLSTVVGAVTAPLGKVAIAPDNPNAIAISSFSAAYAIPDFVFISNDGGTTWVKLPAPNGSDITQRIMDMKVAPVRAGAFFPREYLIATSDNVTNNGNLQIIEQDVGWANICAPGTANFTSCEFSPSYASDRIVLGVGSAANVTSLYTYNARILELAHAAVPLSTYSDWGILNSDIALPSNYDVTVPGFERAYVGIAGSANDGVWRVDDSLTPVDLGLNVPVRSLAYSGTVDEGKLVAGGYVTTDVWHTTDPAADTPTWIAATTPPTGSRSVVVGMHPDVLTNQICYAGTSGWDSGFFTSNDNADTFYSICDACAYLYSSMESMEMLEDEAWDINNPDAGTWTSVNIIPRIDADTSSWGDTCTGLPWSPMYEHCANWVYGNNPWDAPVTGDHEYYRVPFTVPASTCVEVYLSAFVSDQASFYIDGPSYNEPTLFHTVSAFTCTPAEFPIDADGESGADCLVPGKYTIYIDHWDTDGGIYGLIFTAECALRQCPCKADIWINGYSDVAVDAYATGGWQDPAPFISYENAVYESENRVYIRVHNSACRAVNNITVNVYWANVSAGIPWPSGWNLIGEYSILAIPAGGEDISYIEWTPTGTAIGHRCLRVTVDCEADPISTNVWWDDNNVAQRNIEIVELHSSYQTEFVLNPLGQAGERDLKATLLGAPEGAAMKLEIPEAVQFEEVEGASSTKEPPSKWILSCSCLGNPQWEITTISAGTDTTTVISNFTCDKMEIVGLKISVPSDIDTEGEFTLRITEELDGRTIGEIDYIVRY